MLESANPEMHALATDAKNRAIERLAERIDEESKDLPYRWGYFQGAVLVPWSIFIIVATVVDLRKPEQYPTYIPAIVLLLGLVGLPLGSGLLLKRRFALVLVYVMFGLTLLLAAVKIPVAIRHYTDSGDVGSAFSEADLLLVWLLSMIYYRKRQKQFR